MDSNTFSYYERSKSKDPNAPTVLVLDTFRSDMVPVAPGVEIAHGNVSLLAAQNSGYSTIGIQYHDPDYQYRLYTNYADPLNQIDADIRSGKLKGIGKGDVLTISLVDPPAFFSDTTRELGILVTPATLASQKNEILGRVGEIAHDPHVSKQIRDRAQAIVDTNIALDRLREDGLTVIHSAGNTKAYTFSMDFMNAEVQLSSDKPSGKPDTFTVENSLTQKGDGVFPVVYHPEPDLLDPTPLDHQKGSFEILGTGITLANTSHSSFIDNTLIYNREHFDVNKPLPMVRATRLKLTPEMLLPDMTISHDSPLLSWQSGERSPSTSAVGNIDTGMTYKTHPINPIVANSLEPGEMLVVGTISGTSFSNIRYLRDNYKLFRQKKADAFFSKFWDSNDLFVPFK